MEVRKDREGWTTLVKVEKEGEAKVMTIDKGLYPLKVTEEYEGTAGLIFKRKRWRNEPEERIVVLKEELEMIAEEFELIDRKKETVENIVFNALKEKVIKYQKAMDDDVDRRVCENLIAEFLDILKKLSPDKYAERWGEIRGLYRKPDEPWSLE